LLFLGFCHDTAKKDLKSKKDSDLRQAVQAVGEEIRGSGSNIGYRQMTPRLVSDHRQGKETVRALIIRSLILKGLS